MNFDQAKIASIIVSVAGVILLALVAVAHANTPMENFRNGLNAVVGKTEQVPYDVIETKEGFEIRKYPARKWAATSMTGGIDRRDATSAMFRKLFAYISGNNTENMKIAMTAPVSTYYEPGEGPNCENKWTEAFYVPQIHQENPPTGPDVFIEERPEMIILTRRFGGYANDESIAREASELAQLIRDSGETGVDFSTYYVAGYDSPFKPINRRNEIWYIKTNATQETQ